LRNATPFLLVSLSPSVRCCNVRFLEAPFFYYAIVSLHSFSLKYLPGHCWWNTSGFWMNCGSQEGIAGNW
jgi:hypothetical protein